MVVIDGRPGSRVHILSENAGGLVEAAWKLQSLMERAAAVRAARGRGGSESRAGFCSFSIPGVGDGDTWQMRMGQAPADRLSLGGM